MVSSKFKERNESALTQRLKVVRAKNNWTLEQASKRCNIATSTLSKIENGLMSPTYDVLQKLAYGLQLDVAELFTPTPQHMGAGRCVVEKAGQGKVHKTNSYTHELLCSQLSHKLIMPFYSIITAREQGHYGAWNRHAGEEFVYVLSGEVELQTEFYEPARLVAGDSFYIDSQMGHRCISVSPDDAHVLWISTQVHKEDDIPLDE